MDENILQQLESALDQLSTLLDDNAVKTAIGAIPDSIMNPVIDGLKTILDTISDALNELKASLDSVVNLDELLTTINSLLEAAEGLAPNQRSTLDSVRTIVSTLQDLPGLADIDRILGKIGQIVGKLEAL